MTSLNTPEVRLGANQQPESALLRGKSVQLHCAHTHTFKNEVLPRCNPHREHGLSSDIKGHGEAAGRK